MEGRGWRIALLSLSIVLTAGLCCACTQEVPVPDVPVTRTTLSPADSTQSTSTIDINTEWAGERHYNY